MEKNGGKNITRKMKLAWLIIVLGSLLLIAMLLLPFASATKEYKERLLDYPDQSYIEEISMTNKDAVNISLVEFARIYGVAIDQGISKDISIACIVVIAIFAGLSLITLLLSIFKKPIGIIIFNVLSLCAFGLIRFDFKDRGVIPNSSHNWGLANYMTYVVGAVIMAGAVWLFIEKRKIKKQLITGEER